MLLAIGSHPYGALVLGSQGLYVLLTRQPAAPGGPRLRGRRRARDPALAEQPRAREPLRRRRRRRWRRSSARRARCSPTSGTSPATRPPATRGVLVVVLLLALLGLIALARERPRERAAHRLRRPHPHALLPRRPLRRELGARVAPPDLRAAVPRARGRQRDRRRHARAQAASARWLAALVVARARSPPRSPGAGTRRRRSSSARTRSRVDARRRRGRRGSAPPHAATTSSSPTSRSTWPPGSATARRVSRTVVPRADPKLASRRSTRRPSRSGAASGSSTPATTTTPSSGPGSSYACRSRAASSRARAFGPYLVIRTRRPTRDDRALPRRRAQGGADRQVAWDGRRRHQLRRRSAGLRSGCSSARAPGSPRSTAPLRTPPGPPESAACGTPAPAAASAADAPTSPPIRKERSRLRRRSSSTIRSYSRPRARSIRAAAGERGAVEQERHRVRDVVERRPVEVIGAGGSVQRVPDRDLVADDEHSPGLPPARGARTPPRSGAPHRRGSRRLETAACDRARA